MVTKFRLVDFGNLDFKMDFECRKVVELAAFCQLAKLSLLTKVPVNEFVKGSLTIKVLVVKIGASCGENPRKVKFDVALDF